MTTDNRTCATCRWGQFEMTKHNPPRIRPCRAGTCQYDTRQIRLPLSVSYAWNRALRKEYIWPHYSDCPCWEAKPTLATVAITGNVA